MAQLKDLIVSGVTRLLGNVYASKFIGSLQGNADTATKATQDSGGQQINSTYIKGLSVSGKTITYTKGNGSTGTITTQDTTYSAATTSAAGLMSANDKKKLDYTNVVYGTCATAAATAAKTVTITGNDKWTLQVGSIVVVKFTYTNSASSVTLNVNSTGAKSIWWNTAAYTGNSSTVCGQAGRHITYIYNGTYWVWISHGNDINTTYSVATQSANGLMSKDDKAKIDNVDLGKIGSLKIATTAGTGSAYTATVDNFDGSEIGACLVIIPHVVSNSSYPTLNVNSGGAKPLVRYGSNLTSNLLSGYSTAWIAANYPIVVVRMTDYWVVVGSTKPVAADISGAVAVSKGGTGSTTAGAACTMLGAVPKSGATMTGNLVAYSTNRTGYCLRNATVMASDGTTAVSTNGLIFNRK